jgi:hypothetical protein
VDHERCGPVVAVSAIAVVLTAPVAQASDDKPTVLSTVMTGAAEVSGPGDPDGRGSLPRPSRTTGSATSLRRPGSNRQSRPTSMSAHLMLPPDCVGLQLPNRLAADCIRAVPDAQNSTETLTVSELAAIVTTPSNYYVKVPCGASCGGHPRRIALSQD